MDETFQVCSTILPPRWTEPMLLINTTYEYGETDQRTHLKSKNYDIFQKERPYPRG